MSYIVEKNNKVYLSISVKAGAKCSEIHGILEDYLKIRIKEPAVDGKANDAIIRFFSKKLKIAKSKVRIDKGLKTNKKVLEFDLSMSDFMERARLAALFSF